MKTKQLQVISWEETFQKSLSDTRKSATTSFQHAVRMVILEFGHMTEFRWSAHFAGHNLKCAQISRKMDFLQQYNVNSGNWKFGYGGSCEVMRITPEFELEKFAHGKRKSSKEYSGFSWRQIFLFLWLRYVLAGKS